GWHQTRRDQHAIDQHRARAAHADAAALFGPREPEIVAQHVHEQAIGGPGGFVRGPVVGQADGAVSHDRSTIYRSNTPPSGHASTDGRPSPMARSRERPAPSARVGALAPPKISGAT